VIDDAQAEGLSRNGRRITLGASAVVIALAIAAMFWPGGRKGQDHSVLLVFDSSGEVARRSGVFETCKDFLGKVTGRYLVLDVVGDEEAFAGRVAAGASFVLCPDGLSLALDPGEFAPVAVGRRSAPRNLRPRGVLVYRKSAGLIEEPWAQKPSQTVIGDSLSLAATGAWRQEGQNRRSPATGCAWGPDPYDHGPVLHAARLGAFDYALVRQWDADRFFSGGLLSPVEWGVEIMTDPVPDIVLFASRDLPAESRLAVGEAAAALGRGQGSETPEAQAFRRGLENLHLSGFNLLIEPDFELVRGNFTAGWPPAAN
jgi:hypothetical protein